MLIGLMLSLAGCGTDEKAGKGENVISNQYTADTKISEVVNDPAFGDYGRLIFPVENGYYSGDTLGTLKLIWYSNIDPEKTVEIANYMKNHAAIGETIFYDLYTEEKNPDKKDTGLFFFKGTPGEKFSVCNAGGGFVYVGAMQDSFPHALELLKKGYNAFALIYRLGAQTACRKCEPEKENSGSVFHLPQQRLARCLLQKGKCAKNFYLTYKSY